MNVLVAQLYFMILVVGTPASDLVISKKTGGVFSKRVISFGMMKDYLSVQDYIDGLQQ
jgi:hypothetical protein